MYHRLDFQGHHGTLKIWISGGRFRDLKLVAGSERDRSAIDTQSAKPGTMNTFAVRNAIAIIELVAATWPKRGPWVGSSEAGGEVDGHGVCVSG